MMMDIVFFIFIGIKKKNIFEFSFNTALIEIYC